jgi:superfamily II DNA or RNA helicase
MRLSINGILTLSYLTDAEMASLKSDNEWINPEIEIAKKMRRNTWHMPPMIKVWREDDDKLILPRGFLSQLLEQCQPDEVADLRTSSPVEFRPLSVMFREYQRKVLGKTYQHDQGVICAPTGAGKTILGMALIAYRGERTLILVHSKELQAQWKKEIKKWMGLEAGVIGSGKWQEGEEITIAMLQTLHKRPERAPGAMKGYGLTLVDECHHLPASSFSETIGWTTSKFRYGLTATPHRRDGLHQLIFRSTGPIIATIEPEQVEKEGGIVPAVIKRIQTNCSPSCNSWNEYLEYITNDPSRNQLIADLAEKTAPNHPVIILTDRVDHVGAIGDLLMSDNLQIHGSLPAKERRSRMEAIPDHQITIGTTGLLGEGLDVSRWSALIMATPISSKVRLLQAIGRVIRPHEGKSKGYVADLVDDHAFSGSSHNKRKAIYAERGFTLTH